jgi:hypothetical protein
MLFVWLMSLGIGIANACSLDAAQGRHGSAAFAVTLHHDDDAGERSSSSEEAVCLHFCATELTTAVKTKPLDTPSDSQAGPALRLSGLTVSVVDPRDRPTPIVSLIRYELPVSIRFLRLTI